MFVCDDGTLVGVITRKTLVREVVAPGLDPRTTTLGEIAEPPNATIDASAVLADAFAYLEEHDYERVPGRRRRKARRRPLARGRPAAAGRGRRGARTPTASDSARPRRSRAAVSARSGLQRLAEPVADLVVGEAALVVELLVRVADGQLDFGDPGAHRAEHLAELGGRPDAAERTGARADHCDGLVAERVRRERARAPVERVLERAGDRRVVLGRREEDGVGLAHELAERRDSRRSRHDVVVLVVRRHALQPVPENDLDALRRLLAQGAEEGRRVRSVSERAADREDAHRYASWATRVRSALRVTSLESAGSPFGSGMFQFMSNFVRSTVVCELQADAGRPKWSTAGPTIVPLQDGRLRDALDRDLAVDLDRVAVALERAGEADDRVALGVEELGGEQVRLEVLVLGLDALDARRTGELAVGERGVEVGDLAAEGRDRVGDLEGDAGVDGVRLERAGRNLRLRLDGGAHCRASFNNSLMAVY